MVSFLHELERIQFKMRFHESSLLKICYFLAKDHTKYQMRLSFHFFHIFKFSNLIYKDFELLGLFSVSSPNSSDGRAEVLGSQGQWLDPADWWLLWRLSFLLINKLALAGNLKMWKKWNDNLIWYLVWSLSNLGSYFCIL